MREKIFGYAVKEYAASPEYLWARYPGYAVLRRSDSKKWFAVIMDIPFEKIDPRKSGTVDVLNVKVDDVMLRDMLLTQQGFYKAYHMAKGSWVSISLDGRVDESRIYELIDMSYQAAGSKRRK